MVGGKFQCPCCGFFTLDDRGVFDICPVCFWEDDDDLEVFGGEAPERPLGPNYVQLHQARENFRAFGSAEWRNKPHVRPPLPEEIPENNAHQPPYRPVKTLPLDPALSPPLAPPRLTGDQAITIVQKVFIPLTPTTFSAEYGSLTYPRFRRLDDGAILNPSGTRDFWMVMVRDVPQKLPKVGANPRQLVDTHLDYLCLVDDKAETLSYYWPWARAK